VRINNRKIMDGLLQAIGLDPEAEGFESRRLTILRAMDKYDRLGLEGVKALLGEGRKDDSGDFTKGAGLDAAQIDKVAQMVSISAADRGQAMTAMAALVGDTQNGLAGIAELQDMAAIFDALGYDADRLAIDPSVVRGLGYYTGPVYEIELTFEAQDESGELARFGSVGGGGRYDDLVKRFKGVEIPATGISIGVSRLAAALMLLGQGAAATPAPLVVVTVMDKETRPDLMALVSDLRAAGLRAEMYMGDSAMKAQLRYADARGARLVVIEGEDERAAGVVTLKDLHLGAEKSAEIEDNAEWRASEHAQKQVKRADLVAEIQKIIS
jgi:histidyl-tRNA synthetase